MFSHFWRIRFEGQGISDVSFIIVPLSKKLQLQPFGYYTWPYRSFDNILINRSALVYMQHLSHLCSRSVAWISHTLTRERRFFISVQISDMYKLPMLWMSSRNRAAWQKGMRVYCRVTTSDFHNKHSARINISFLIFWFWIWRTSYCLLDNSKAFNQWPSSADGVAQLSQKWSKWTLWCVCLCILMNGTNHQHSAPIFPEKCHSLRDQW